MGGQVIVVVRQSDSDGHADGLSGSSYRWSGIVGRADGQVFRLDERSDDVGQPNGCGRMVYRWSDREGWSDGWISGLTGGVTD